MTDGLTQRKPYPDAEIYLIRWDGTNVGRIEKRSGNPHGTPPWSWQISTGIESGPSGLAGSYEEAKFTWKKHWPAFRDTKGYDEWRKIREYQESSSKRQDIVTARKRTSNDEELALLDFEMNQPGPTPEWVKEIIDRR